MSKPTRRIQDAKSWQRALLPACARCSRLLSEAGDAGRVYKATGVRWFGGHRVGRFEAKGAPGYREEASDLDGRLS